MLDVDVKPEGNGFSALNQLKRAGIVAGAAALVRTRSGGLHLYFAGTDQGCHALPRHYLDFKARGGYVLAPPSASTASRTRLLDHRPGTAALDWQKVIAVLDPPRSSPCSPPRSTMFSAAWGTAVRQCAGRLRPLRRTGLPHCTGSLAHACGQGMDESVIHELAADYEPAVAKYGPRLHAEVDRSLSRIGVS